MSVVRHLALLLTTTLVACGGGMQPFDPGPPTPAYARQVSSIVGGTLDTGDPAVVALAVSDGHYVVPFCTGTLIAPKTVLTAAHCVNAYGSSYTYYAFFGTYVDTPTHYVRITQQVRHPNYIEDPPQNDMGVLRLESAVTNVTPIPLNTTPLTSAHEGLPIRHVGFGVSNAQQQSGMGTKRQVTYAIREVSQREIESGATGKQTCGGDSGGPGFVVLPGTSQEVVAGVVSYGDMYCNQFGVDMNVAYYAGWVQQTMNAWEGPTCAEDGQCKPGCTPVDVDCVCAGDGTCNIQCPDLAKDPDCPADCVPNGVCAQESCPVPDPDCVPEGETCTSSLQCLWRQCVSDPQHVDSYCSRPCTQTTQCPIAGMVCTDGVCRWAQQEMADIGEPCTTETYCLDGGICTGPSVSERYCVLPCSGPGTCPGTNQACVTSFSGVLYCELSLQNPDDPKGPSPGRVVFLPRAKIDGQVAAAGCSSAGGSNPMWLAGLALAALAVGRRGQRRLPPRTGAAGVLVAAGLGLTQLGCGPLQEDGGEPPAALVDQVRQQIVGGTVDTGDPEVFMLAIQFSNGSGSVCTGTLIADRTIATAAHCVDPRIGGATSSTIWVMNRTSVAQATSSDWIPIIETRMHPGWDPFVSLDDDIAMALLERAPSTPKKPWNTQSLSGFGGRPIRVVGYGITGNDKEDSGIKRQVNLTIQNVQAEHIYLGDNAGKGICHGDSGGPTFHTFPDGVERLIGIHSYDANGDCTFGGDIRIDRYTTFVNQWLSEKEGPQCAEDGMCRTGCVPMDVDCHCVADGTCNPHCPDLTRDPDCPANCAPDGVCAIASCAPAEDPDCVPVGEPCTSELQCQSRQCLSDPQHSDFYCSRTCTTTAECPEGMECVEAANVCRFQQLPASTFKGACTPGATFCPDNTVCTGPAGGGATFCELPCLTDVDCPEGNTCVEGQGGVRYCQAPFVAKPVMILPRADLSDGKVAAGCAAAGGSPMAGFALLGLALSLARAMRPGSRAG